MTNHGFINIKEKMSLEQIKKDILVIGKKYFRNCIIVKKFKDKTYGDCLDVMFKHNANKIMVLWCNEDDIIEIRPDNVWGLDWIEATIKHNLSYKYRAPIGDEGIGYETYMGEPNKYPTFRSWVIRMKSIGGRKMNFFERKHVDNSIKNIVEEYGEIFDDN